MLSRQPCERPGADSGSASKKSDPSYHMTQNIVNKCKQMQCKTVVFFFVVRVAFAVFDRLIFADLAICPDLPDPGTSSSHLKRVRPKQPFGTRWAAVSNTTC